MSKEELLKYLIAEIDLIMHDKDYRFENANGTWYSRESCRDLTNEEVFEELRTELRQFDDLETKLAESEEQLREELEEKNGVRRALSACNRQNDEFAEMIKKLVNEKEELKQQLAEKDEKIEKLKSENHALMSDNAYQEADIFELTQKFAIHNQDKISFAVEQLEQVKYYILTTQQDADYLVDKEQVNIHFFKDVIDNQIKKLTHQNEGKGDEVV